jgi:hypothetical protein
MYREDDYYLSLPLDYRRYTGIVKEKKSVYNFIKKEIIK